MDRAARADGVKFLFAFAAWATLAFLPAWAVAHPWQHALAAVASRLVAPPGTSFEMLDLELFYPIDLAVFVALCLASVWVPRSTRWRAALIGAPVMIVLELLALASALAALFHASRPGQPGAELDAALRYADALIRVVGLALAGAVWYVVLGHRRFGWGGR